MRWAIGGVVLALIAAVACAAAAAQQRGGHEGYKDTPMLPGGKWHVHDPDRPLPPVVDPGTPSTNRTAGRPPSDAIVLFDGKDLSQWEQPDGSAPTWIVEKGVCYRHAAPGKKRDMFTRQEFGDCQLHVEFCEPTPPKGVGQLRGNSGVFFHRGRYEIQVLDCYENPSYADGMSAAVYGQHPPLVNACRKPGVWQMYDIIWTSPRFNGQALLSPAYVTIIHNGVVVQNHTPLFGPTGHRRAYPYSPHPVRGKIGLQDHRDTVRFRNIWVRELKGYDE